MNFFTVIRSEVKNNAIKLARVVIRILAAFNSTRGILNVIYLKLSPQQKDTFHKGFAKIFRNSNIPVSNGLWKIKFHEKVYLMPLTRERFWQEWDSAISILGHDIEIKETYDSLLCSHDKPDLFIDIGANYGTHSLLFIVQGIETITFEPNSSCHDYFYSACKLNGVEPYLEPIALGNSNEHIELSYPEHDTWLGTTRASTLKNLSETHQLTTVKVEQKQLDDFITNILSRNTLIKIDTEGNELSVLKGAERILNEARPKVIFESFHDSERIELYNYLSELGYNIHCLPWAPDKNTKSLEEREFVESMSNNFIAVPLQ
jgi:FkbM family methyltransferase